MLRFLKGLSAVAISILFVFGAGRLGALAGEDYCKVMTGLAVLGVALCAFGWAHDKWEE